jgi:uncharacterized metal-binding protein YceD (DUF177 family)
MAALPPDPELEYSFPLDATQIPALGREYDLTAKDAERARVAKRIDVLELKSLVATMHVGPGGGGLIEVRGRLKAELVQACVVTLEPVPDSIAEEFTLLFSRQAPKPKPAQEVVIDNGEDPPEVLNGDVLDLGEVIVEQLALAVNPYPRAPGAEFKPVVVGEVEAPIATVSPFAALAKLKTKSENK